jgi:tetratricopeptide (TPR) repeat protein
MRKRVGICLAAGTLLALLAAAQPALAQREFDQVFMTKGAPSRGLVTDMNRDEVKLDMSGATRTIDVSEIVRITFRDEPSELNVARTTIIAQKNYNQGLVELRKLDGAKVDRDYVKQDIEYYRALCQCKLAMNEGGDRVAADKAMFNFVRSAPQSYHFYEAAELLGDLAMAGGKWADAAKYYGPIAGAKWPDYQMRANNAIGRALVGEKKYDEALEKFKAVSSSEQSTAEANRQKNLAAVGRAVCQAETGKADEGIAALQDLINKNDPQDSVLFARAYNALGRGYLKQNKPKDAVLAYLHTDVLFYNDADAHAEALYHLSKLWSDINKSDRALAARSTLRERYAGSVWATLE